MPITFKSLSHVYNEDTPFPYAALKDINLDIKEHGVSAIIGETGSGKSTLVQHLNALLLPTQGEVEVLGNTIRSGEKPKNIKELRRNVGLVFQFPEYQLFEETILKDICFGPKNFGVTDEEAVERAKQAIRIVGLDETYFEKSPFELSGGQKRRVAIAGILAMNPDVLVLDEPTAGLDPQGAQDMMKLFVHLNKEMNKTILIVTHDMQHVLDYCEEVIVVKDGHIEKKCDVETFFEQPELLKQLNIEPPAVIKMREMLNEKGFHIDSKTLTIKDLADEIIKEVL